MAEPNSNLFEYVKLLESVANAIPNDTLINEIIKQELTFYTIPIQGLLMLFSHEISYVVFLPMPADTNIPVYSKIKIVDKKAKIAKIESYDVLALDLTVNIFVKEPPFFVNKAFVPITWKNAYMLPMHVSLEEVQKEAEKQGVFGKLKNMFSRSKLSEAPTGEAGEAGDVGEAPVVEVEQVTINENLQEFIVVLHSTLGTLRDLIVDKKESLTELVATLDSKGQLTPNHSALIVSLSGLVEKISQQTIVAAFNKYKASILVRDNSLTQNKDYIYYRSIIQYLIDLQSKLKYLNEPTIYTFKVNINNSIIPLHNVLPTVFGIKSGLANIGKTTATVTGKAYDATVRALGTGAQGVSNAWNKAGNILTARDKTFQAVASLPPRGGGGKRRTTKKETERIAK